MLLGTHVVVTGNRGITYVLDQSDLSHVTSQLDTCPSQGAPAASGNLLVIPCASGGPKAFMYANAGQLTPLWTAPVDRGRLADARAAARSGWSIPSAASSTPWTWRQGAVRGQVTIGPAPRYASPTLSADHAYVGTMDGVVAVAGA